VSALALLLLLAAAPHADATVRTPPRPGGEGLSALKDDSGMPGDPPPKIDPPTARSATGEAAPVLTAPPILPSDAVQCPTSEAVERRLSALRAPGAAAHWFLVDVERSGSVLTVRAATAAGDARFERSLPASGPCEELEQAAAVVLLAWEAQLAPGSVPVPLLERREVAAPRVAEPARERLRVSAQGAAWLSSATPAGGGGGSLEWRPSRLPIALALDVFGQARRTLSVAEGTGTWSRLSFALGATGSFSLDERVSMTVGLGLASGPFWLDGAGYQTNLHLLDWDLGLSGRVLLYLPGLGPVRPFVGVNGVAWLRRHEAHETGPNGGQRLLPAFEVAPCAGLAVTL
jgi:hypothetical protein